MREADRRGEELGLTEAEAAFYKALEVNDSAVAVLGDDTLRTIARELGVEAKLPDRALPVGEAERAFLLGLATTGQELVAAIVFRSGPCDRSDVTHNRIVQRLRCGDTVQSLLFCEERGVDAVCKSL